MAVETGGWRMMANGRSIDLAVTVGADLRALAGLSESDAGLAGVAV